MSAGEILSEARGFETLRQRAAGIVLGAGLVAGTACVMIIWAAPAPFVKISSGLSAVATLLLGVTLRGQLRGTPLPDGMSFAQSLTRYRSCLERHCLLVRTLRWYVVPLMLGPATLVVATALHRPDRLAPTAAVLALGAALSGWSTRRTQAGSERRIKQLAAVTENKS
jgi:hypothetical protein